MSKLMLSITNQGVSLLGSCSLLMLTGEPEWIASIILISLLAQTVFALGCLSDIAVG